LMTKECLNDEIRNLAISPCVGVQPLDCSGGHAKRELQPICSSLDIRHFAASVWLTATSNCSAVNGLRTSSTWPSSGMSCKCAGWEIGASVFGFLAVGRDHCRQINFRCRAMSGFAVNVNKSAVALDDAFHRRESKACAFANFFGGEKRIVNMFHDFRGDAGAG